MVDGESSVYTSCGSTRSGTGRWSTVLSGSVDRFMFWRIRVKVDICKSETGTYKYRVVRKPQLGLIDLNRHCFSEMKTRSSDLYRS